MKRGWGWRRRGGGLFLPSFTWRTGKLFGDSSWRVESRRKREGGRLKEEEIYARGI